MLIEWEQQRHLSFVQIDAWMLKVFSGQAIQYLEGSFEIFTADIIWLIDELIDDNVPTPMKFTRPGQLKEVLDELCATQSLQEHIWLTKVKDACRILSWKFGNTVALMEIIISSECNVKDYAVPPFDLLLEDMSSTLFHFGINPSTPFAYNKAGSASTIASNFFKV